jgi:hypothetical protein
MMAKTQTSNKSTAAKTPPVKPAAKLAAKAKSNVVAPDEHPRLAGQQISNQPATPWEFTLSDHHRVAPDEDRRAILAALEIPVFKHKERLKYAGKWGLDPAYVVVTDRVVV